MIDQCSASSVDRRTEYCAPNGQAGDVLRFWFGYYVGDDTASMPGQLEWWFRGGADAAIAQRFSVLLDRAINGGLDSWSRSPGSRLALIIVLDQFSRSLYSGSARAFAQDAKALALTLEGIEVGHYSALRTVSLS
jgi:uncharacterized protein (DUF924 family)